MTPTKNNHKEDFFPTVLSDFFDNNFLNKSWFERDPGHALPAVNVLENKNEFKVELAVPGFQKKDFKINLQNEVLTISAEKKSEKNEEREQFTRREFTYNSFSRSFNLPKSVDPDNIDANYADGILKLKIPKKEEAKNPAKKEIKIA